MASPVASYTRQTDATLTDRQQSSGFRPDIVDAIHTRGTVSKGAFRDPSNPTDDGYRTGYHEAFAPTDMAEQLAHRKVQGPDAMMTQYSGTFAEANVLPVLHASDGSRTDTARTILSAPVGHAAGHSGSGVRQTGQSAAHDLMRAQVFNVLQDRALSADAIAVIAGASAVMSIAPGMVASTAENAGSLKDRTAKTTWEADRNEGKSRVQVEHAKLPPLQQKRVNLHMKQLLIATGDKNRELAPNEPFTPRRDTGFTGKNVIAGGQYTQKALDAPSLSPPVHSHATTTTKLTYMTQPFRNDRQG